MFRIVDIYRVEEGRRTLSSSFYMFDSSKLCIMTYDSGKKFKTLRKKQALKMIGRLANVKSLVLKERGRKYISTEDVLLNEQFDVLYKGGKIIL